MFDYLLLAGVALFALSVVVAVVQLLQTQPPRAAAILLIGAIVAVLAWAYLSPDELQPSAVTGAWQRVTSGATTAP